MKKSNKYSKMLIKEILIEHNLQYLLSLFSDKYKQVQQKDHSNEYKSLEEFIKSIEELLRKENKFQFIDPYIKWIVQRYVTNNLGLYEDVVSKVIPGLLTYDSLKRKNKLKPIHKDINQVKNIHQLLNILDEYQDKDTKSNKEKEKKIEENFYKNGEAELIYNDSKIKIVVPKTEEASCYFGRNTRWCTAATKSDNRFYFYNEKGPLYIILDKKNNKRYQFHFPTNQFKDERDFEIDPEELGKEHPILWKIFSPIAKKEKSLYFLPEVTDDELIDILKTKEEPDVRRFYKSNKDRFINSLKLMNFVVTICGDLIEDYLHYYKDEVTDDILLKSFLKGGYVKSLKYLKNKNFSDSFIMKLIEKNPKSVRYLEDIPDNVILLHLKKNNDYFLTFLDKKYFLNKDLMSKILEISPKSIYTIYSKEDDIPKELIKEYLEHAIKYDPSVIVQIVKYFSKNKIDDRIIIKALSLEKGNEIFKELKEPSEEVQIFAVTKDPRNIKYIKKPSMKVLETLIKNNPNNLYYLNLEYYENIPERLLIYAVSKQPNVLRFIPKKTNRLKYEALKNDKEMVSKIDYNNADEKLENLALEILEQNPELAKREFYNVTPKIKQKLYDIRNRYNFKIKK
ncbi:MAG: hypothetical protein NZZ41_05465 [Candidatus Dojkabacteria bacterium]|nr:hypothetical protein [Candidatus Dojkabacteria bacterium]